MGIRIGVDFHGVFDKHNKIFWPLIKTLTMCGHDVHLLTGNPNDDAFKKELRKYCATINFTTIFSITDYLWLSKRLKYKIDKKGGKVFPKKEWNKAKADYCKKMKIQLMIDDSNIYHKYFDKIPYLRLMNEKNNRRR